MRPRPPTRPLGRAGRSRGFALLLVLWTLPILSLTASNLIRSGHDEATIAANLRDAALLQAATDGAIQEAAWQVFAGKWPVDGTVHAVRVPPVSVEVTVGSEAGRINPNNVSPDMLRWLLLQLDVEPTRAMALAAAISDYRSPGDIRSPNGAKSADYAAAGLPYGPTGVPFTSLDELGFVLGMTPDVLDRMRPHLSLYQEGGIDPQCADPIVLAVLAARHAAGADRPGDSIRSPNVVLRIVATARAGQAAFSRQATVRLRASPAPDRPLIQILDWRTVRAGDRP